MRKISFKVVNLSSVDAIREIRRLVFQVEQSVDAALDFDGQDEIAEHIVAYVNQVPVGTARIRYLDNKRIAKLERLAVLPEFRRQGIGRGIMEMCIEYVVEKSIAEVQLNAQEYVKNLYKQLGFEQEGETFEEAGILHVKMRRQLR